MTLKAQVEQLKNDLPFYWTSLKAFQEEQRQQWVDADRKARADEPAAYVEVLVLAHLSRFNEFIQREVQRAFIKACCFLQLPF